MATSKLEDSFMEQLAGAQLDQGLVREHRFSESRRWRIDFAWPHIKLAVEVQGGIFNRGRHCRPLGMMNDWHKMFEGTLLGWTWVMVGPVEIKNGEALDRVGRIIELIGKDKPQAKKAKETRKRKRGKEGKGGGG